MKPIYRFILLFIKLPHKFYLVISMFTLSNDVIIFQTLFKLFIIQEIIIDNDGRRII